MRVEGTWRTREVLVNGHVLDVKPSLEVWNHSPDGFNWGYAGSGPAQLALAILLHYGVPRDRAVRLHQRFKFDWIMTLPQDDFAVDIDLHDWLARQ